MTKLQALTLADELAAVSMPCSVSLNFNAAGKPNWTVALPANIVYTGAQLAALASACEQMELQLTAQFAALGIV